MPIDAPPSLPYQLDTREATIALIKHFGLHEGVFVLSYCLDLTVGQVGPSKEQTNPGVLVGISGVGLAAAPDNAKHAVNAAEVNPAPRKAKKKAG